MLSVYAAFNTKTGEMLFRTADRHTSAKFVAFLNAAAPIVSRFRGRSVAEFRVRGLQAVQARLERLQGLIARGHSSERMVPVIEFRGDRSFASLLRFPAGVEVIARGVARRDPEALSKLHEQSDDLER